MQPRRLVVSAILLLASTSATAFAAQIAVLAPQLKPPGAVELRDRFHDAVTRAMSKAGDVMPADEVRSKLGSQADVLNCSGSACARKAALALSVERVVTVDVEYVGKDYSIRIHAFDAAGNDLGPVGEEKCDICTVREAARASERAADRAVAIVGAGLVKAAPVVVKPVEAPPVGMTETPTTPRPSTPPAVTPTTPSATPTTPAATPAITPVPSAPVAGGSDKAGGLSTYRIGAYTAFGIAAAALIPTAVFGYYASKEKAGTRGLYTGTGCDGAALPQISCPKIYDGNKAPAAVFGVATGLAAATGAVLLYLDIRNQKRPAATFIGVPTRDGFAVSTSVEF